VEIKGSVTIKIKKAGGVTTPPLLKDKYDVTIAKNNAISLEFATALASALVTGVNTAPYGTLTQPQGVVILLKNNGVVVAQLPVTLQSFDDVLQSTSETTTVTFIASDSTPAQYTFNEADIYTVSQNALYLKIAFVYVNPITKGVDDIVQITWTLIATSYIPFNNFPTLAQQNCSATCSGTCNAGTLFTQALGGFVTQQPPISLFNFAFAFTIVPNLQSVAQGKPMGWLATFISQAPPNTQLLGIASVYLTDGCFNPVAQWVIGNPTSGVQITYDNEYVYASFNILASPSGAVNYMLVNVGIGTPPNTIFIFYPLAILTVTGVSVQGQVQTFGILIKIPYGSITTKQVTQT